MDNVERAAAARKALEKYADIKGMDWEDDMSRLSDLLTDLMHLCAQNAEQEDCPMNFDRALTVAQANYEAEK